MSVLRQRPSLRKSNNLVASSLLVAGLGLAACGEDPSPNGVIVALAPEVVSSLDKTITVSALVIDDRTPVKETPVRFSITYTDRNGAAHTIDPIAGETDARGAAQATFTGLEWEGTGTITVEAMDGDAPIVIDDVPVAGTATFAVLDRTPPTVTILPPTADLHIGPGLPLEVEVQVGDEIGVSQVILQAAGELDSTKSRLVASGTTEETIRFQLDIPDNAQPGPTITLFALATDLSGNQAAAEPIVLTVDESIAIATPAGLTGALLGNGDNNFLDDPRALALSPMDGFLYVADNSGGGTCNGGCIRKVDPTTGLPVGGAVALAVNNEIEGIAFDADGNTLYFTDRQGDLRRLTYNVGAAAYQTNTLCSDGNDPQDGFHLVHDGTRVLVVEANDKRVHELATCTGSPSTQFSDNVGDQPRGIALGGAGEIFVSDFNQGEIHQVDPANGNVTTFLSHSLDRPYGLEWLAGGTSEYADTLMIADEQIREVLSTDGNNVRPTAYLRNSPIDVAIGNGTMYVLTRPGNNDPGRIFTVSGF